ncbi:MAG: ImmA/IrrE family metallo-endopeptidase [Thermoanaerobaculaceae bacterium]|nr:ImmA/IrrE family metallo-endopeptidase [Thermoanaerobaculaceae bacterium]MDI9622283.1 XRE family transcriptional regulator [Acidobacteriota bacterium]NLH11075.1 ImmA/IrrE family metallo-endopeptidase [Holophagae bacterium]HPW55038.1 XRE family transcriptional regulator [Thermoanaerobaculaceae bacterium]
MVITHDQLAERIRQAREAAGFTQDEVARVLATSRPTVAQIEAGNRKVTSVELATLARLFGRSMHDFFEDAFERDGVAFVWRALPETREDPAAQEGMTRGIEIINAILDLERVLGLERLAPRLPQYRLAPATTTREAVGQGDELAGQERQRLRLGSGPVADPGTLLESEGVLVLSLDLPQGVSGLTFQAKRAMVCVISSKDAPVRQRYSLAHEYCHAICDLAGAPGIVSREGQRKDPKEVRADAFAAAFLMPAEGLRGYLASLGKGQRSRAGTGSEVREVEAVYEPRRITKGREIDIWDVTRLANYFGTSRTAVIWRLFNLHMINKPRRKRLSEEESKGYGRQLAGFIGDLDAELRPPERPRLPPAEQRLFTLALDAARAGEISRQKLVELLKLVGLSEEEVYTIPLARREDE